MKWVAQVSKYWPVSRLAKMTNVEMEAILDGESGLPTTGKTMSLHHQHRPGDSEVNSLHALEVTPTAPPGRILLVGSGSEHPALLTVAMHNALTKKMGRTATYGTSKVGLNGFSVHMQVAENDRIAAEKEKGEASGKPRVRYYVYQPGVLRTAFIGHHPMGKAEWVS